MPAPASGGRNLLPAKRPAARQGHRQTVSAAPAATSAAALPLRRRRRASAPPRPFGGDAREERRANRAARALPDSADRGCVTLLETSSISRATKADYDRRLGEFQTFATTRSPELSSPRATDAALATCANCRRRDGALNTEVEKVYAALIFHRPNFGPRGPRLCRECCGR